VGAIFFDVLLWRQAYANLQIAQYPNEPFLELDLMNNLFIMRRHFKLLHFRMF